MGSLSPYLPVYVCAVKASLGYMRPCCRRNHLAQTKGILRCEPAMLGYLFKHFKVWVCYARRAPWLRHCQRFPTASCHRLWTITALTLGIRVSLNTRVAVAVLRFRKMVKDKMAMGWGWDWQQREVPETMVSNHISQIWNLLRLAYHCHILNHWDYFKICSVWKSI